MTYRAHFLLASAANLQGSTGYRESGHGTPAAQIRRRRTHTDQSGPGHPPHTLRSSSSKFSCRRGGSVDTQSASEWKPKVVGVLRPHTQQRQRPEPQEPQETQRRSECRCRRQRGARLTHRTGSARSSASAPGGSHAALGCPGHRQPAAASTLQRLPTLPPPANTSPAQRPHRQCHWRYGATAATAAPPTALARCLPAC